MSVKVAGLTKIYGQQRAVDAISFSAQPGEILGFLGPNGAGKSTTMKVATGFIPPSEGSVEVCGIDVMNQPVEARRKIGYLPENNPLYLDMYVHEYLLFMASAHGLKGAKAKARVTEMVVLCGLTKEQNKKIGMLSKGYRQRVGLAQALLHDPEVLILDEPTTGLDPNQLVEIRKLIKEISK
ncbi:MAG: ATP-binding cassette domain-containing protein, partial [Cytophagia bacterium]|nr:ATP-binding cassette domain-containing protein [Cytophagia bacterium]